jgi:hypothetical protein
VRLITWNVNRIEQRRVFTAGREPYYSPLS